MGFSLLPLLLTFLSLSNIENIEKMEKGYENLLQTVDRKTNKK